MVASSIERRIEQPECCEILTKTRVGVFCSVPREIEYFTEAVSIEEAH